MIVRRVVVAASLLAAGALAGFMGAAAALRGWLASRGESSSDELSAVAIFDSFELTSASAGGSVLAWFGGAAIDLSGATLAPGALLDPLALHRHTTATTTAHANRPRP